MNIKTKEWLIVVVLAALLVAIVAVFFEPFSDEYRQWYQFDATQDMPQDR